MPVVAKYGAATLIPLLLLILGGTVWGGFAVAALLWLTLAAALMDHVLEPPSGSAVQSGWSDGLPVLLALGHLALLPLVLTALAEPELSVGYKIALFFATASFIGQVSHPNAHELIHRKARLKPALGALVYVTMGFGHHVSAHRLVHHRFVATPQDPNTPHMGEGFWHYLPRAWSGSFRAGLAAETERLARAGRPAMAGRNPYWVWVSGAILTAGLAAVSAGPVGLATLIGLWALTGTQILMSDYIQHYGLRRLPLPSGRLEPVGPHHSWNAPRGFSSYLMMNAPSHSDHHMHPDRVYDMLASEPNGPTLPRPLPVMAMIATVPPIWHRLMDHRAARMMSDAEADLTSAQRAA